MKKLALILAVVMLLCCFAACGGGGTNPGGNTDPNKPTEKEPELLSDGVTYDSNTYLPIVKTPITLEAMLSDNGTQGDYNKRTLWQDIEDKTGIKINLRLVVNSGEGEAAALIFMGRDYPDISFRLDSKNHDVHVNDAALAGDIVELSEELLAAYAPNWKKIFDENPDVYKLSKHNDGKLYGLPNIEMLESSINLRDCMFINSEWLDELALDKPTTIDEFTDYLRAVKNAAGNGTIPSDVMPLYVRNWSNLGGWWNFMDMYGIYNGFNGEVVVDETTVVCNYTNPNMKVPIKYLKSLYDEGLVTMSSDSYDQYMIEIDEAGTSRSPWRLGSYFGFWNCEHEWLDYLAPLTFNDTVQPYVRDMGINSRLLMDNYFIFTNCKYPIAALRLADTYAVGDNLLRMSRGEEGQNYKKLEDGTYVLNKDFNLATGWNVYGLYNYGPGYTSPEVVEQLYREDFNNGFSRSWAYENIYKDYLPTNMKQFPTEALAFLSEEDRSFISTTYNRMNTYVGQMTHAWITGNKGRDIDNDWDNYITQLNNIGLEKYLELKQQAWDAYSAAMGK